MRQGQIFQEKSMELTVIPLYAGLLGLFYTFLSFRVIRLRRSEQIGVGDGGVSSLTKAMRVHGNFSEYVPFTLLLLAFLEVKGMQPWILHIFAATLIVSRMLHHFGLSKSKGVSFGRFYGALLTFVIMIVASIACIVKTFL